MIKVGDKVTQIKWMQGNESPICTITEIIPLTDDCYKYLVVHLHDGESKTRKVKVASLKEVFKKMSLQLLVNILATELKR